jgi:hypothetical protein
MARLVRIFSALRWFLVAIGRYASPSASFVPDKYVDVVAGIEPAIAVKIVPGLGHMHMLHAPPAIDAIGDTFRAK